MGLFSGKPNRNGFLNRIANPDPNGRGLLGRIANPIQDPNGGLLDRLFGGKRNQPTNNSNQPQSYQEPTNNQPPSGSSW